MEQSLQQCTKCEKWKNVEQFPLDKRYKIPIRRRKCESCARPDYIDPSIAKIKRLNNQERYLLTSAKQRSKRKGIEFNIELEDIFIPSHCPLLGIQLEMSGDPSHYNSPSLDRIDPCKGYIKGNIWVISKRANSIKTNATLEEISRVSVGLKDKFGISSKHSSTKQSNTVYLEAKKLMGIADQLGMNVGGTIIDLTHEIKRLSNLSSSYENRLSKMKRSLSECLAISRSASYSNSEKDTGMACEYFLRFRVDGVILEHEKEVVCNPGGSRYDSFKVTDTGKPLSGEYGLAIVMANLRKDIHKILRAYGVKKSKELRRDRNA